jgi:hypothetical protein
MNARTYRRGWHAAWLALTLVIVSLAVAIAAPSQASAATCLTISRDGNVCGRAVIPSTPLASLGYTGWTRLNLNYCASGRICAALYRTTTLAWSWTGTQWVQASLRGGYVYVAPYSGQWRWAWTQDTGWVAISGGRFERLPVQAIDAGGL